MNPSFLFRAAIGLWLVGLISWSSVADAQLFGNHQDSKQVAKDAKQKFSERFPLIVIDGVLSFEFPANSNEANEIVNELAAGGGSGSSINGGSFSCTSENDYIKAEVGNMSTHFMMMGINDKSSEHLSIRGMGAEFWSTQLIKTDKQTLCSHFDLEAKIMLQLISNKTESRLIMFDGPKMIALQGRNFLDLVGQPDFQRFAQRAESCGIKLPSNISATLLDEMMIGVFQVSASDWEDFAKDFADLAAETFKEREAATQRLKSEMKQWESLVAWALSQETVSTEMKSRLLAAIKDETSESAKQISELISSKLMDNPAKLVDLLTHPSASDEKVLLSITDRLKQLTENDFGKDVAAWRKWADENLQVKVAQESQPDQKGVQSADQRGDKKEVAEEGKANDAKIAEPENVTDRISIALVREQVSNLLTVDINDQDRLCVDRDRWAKRFGSKKIPELLQETKDRFKESGLPESWLNLGGGFDPTTVDYPQLLFAQVEDFLTHQVFESLNPHFRQMQQHQRIHRSNMMRTATLNRVYQEGTITFRLDLHPESRNFGNRDKKLKEDFFKFSYVDEQHNDCLILNEQPKTGLSLLICRFDADEFVSIGQDDQQCWVHVSTPAGSLSISDSSARKLFEEHSEKLKRLLHPVLQYHGVDLAEATGGALEMKNAVLKMKGRRGLLGR